MTPQNGQTHTKAVESTPEQVLADRHREAHLAACQNVAHRHYPESDAPGRVFTAEQIYAIAASNPHELARELARVQEQRGLA